MLGNLLAIGAPFIPSFQDLRPFAPELWLIGGIIAVLLAPLMLRKTNLASAVIALVAMGAALLSVVFGNDGTVGSALRGMLLVDSVSLYWKGILLLFVIGIVMMWLSSLSHTMHEGDAPEYFTLLLTATLGMCLMASTANLLMLVIAVEMASLPSYVLAGFRKTHRLGAEASLKYVLFGAASSALMIYGLSLLYGMFGTLQLDGTFGIAAKIATTSQPLPLLIFAAASIIVGLGFKISAVPLHFWCPDVFEGAGIDVAAFLSVASKGAAILLLTRVFMLAAEAVGFQGETHISMASLAVVLGLIGAVTATVGNTAAFNQTNIKRLLAWSSIAHAGYIMCAISLLVSNDLRIIRDGANMPMQAILVYLSVYLFMNLGAFTVAAVIYRATGSETLDAYRGLGRRAPFLAMLMTGFMFSLVGLPPFAGFVAKLNLMWRLAENGSWWWALVAVIAVNTVFSLYYYARVVKAMYLEQSDDERPLRTSAGGVAIAFGCCLMLVAMFIGFSPFTRITQNASHMAGIDVPVRVTAAK